MPNRRQNLFDELLHDALEILRLGAGERGKVLQILTGMEKELKQLLSEEDFSRFNRTLLNKLLRNANATIGQYYSQLQLSADLVGIGRYAVESTSFALQISLGLDGVRTPKADYFKSLASNVLIEGAPSSAWWQSQSADTQFKFARQVRSGLAAGETNQQIIQRIVGKQGVPGVMDVVRRNATALVQTSVQAVANDARRNTYKANDDIVKGIQQVSTLDGHTSLTCVAYSGCQWDLEFKPIGKKKLAYNGGTPRHFNCRSLETPLTKTFREMGIDVDEPNPTTRASDEGQIAADTTFEGFLDRKTKAYQDSMLGEGRGDLWRAGKITLRDLVNGEGRPRSLHELIELVKNKKGG